MKELIRGQTIRIDNHDSGSGKATTWGSGVHIHKKMNSDRYNSAEVIIPLDKEGEIQFKKLQGRHQRVERQLKNEINKALRDKVKRQEFVTSVLKRLESYSSVIPRTEMVRNLRQGAKNLASHFDLESTILEESEVILKGQMKSFLTEHLDDKGKIFYVLQDVLNKQILVGDNLDEIENWEEQNQ
jgi:glycerophosphoryl diester phosphodiesterase